MMVEAVAVFPFAAERRDAAFSAARHAEALSPRRRFENMLDRHETRLRRVALGMLGDPDRVDDVLQDAFLRAFLRLPTRFENERAEEAWLYRIVYRCCLNELRARKRRREDELDPEQPAASEDTVESLTRAAALAELTPNARAVLLLVDLIGLDYEEAASVLAIRRGTVAWRLHVARAKFREAWERGNGE